MKNGPSKSQDTAEPSTTLVKPPEIDRPPDNWQSDGERQREPIFGPGAAPLLAELIISAGALGLLFLVLLLAGTVREKAYGVIFGEPQLSKHLKPGNSTVTDGYKIKGIDQCRAAMGRQIQ